MSRLLITVPVRNEASIIVNNLELLLAACASFLPTHDWTVEVADNGSTDDTAVLVRTLIEKQPRLRLRSVNGHGKGWAIRESWIKSAGESTYDAFLFTDADLAADLKALPALVNPILDGSADVVCGSRYIGGAQVARSWLRTLVSKLYRRWQKIMLRLPVEDAQCGLKAVSPRVVRELVPQLQELAWLFDSELLALIQMRGWTIKEIPVVWIEHRDGRRQSSVRLWLDGWQFIWGVWKIRRRVIHRSGLT